jgi:hypothetical protein
MGASPQTPEVYRIVARITRLQYLHLSGGYGNAEVRPERRLKRLNGRGGYGRPTNQTRRPREKLIEGEIWSCKPGPLYIKRATG